LDRLSSWEGPKGRRRAKCTTGRACPRYGGNARIAMLLPGIGWKPGGPVKRPSAGIRRNNKRVARNKVNWNSQSKRPQGGLPQSDAPLRGASSGHPLWGWYVTAMAIRLCTMRRWMLVAVKKWARLAGQMGPGRHCRATASGTPGASNGVHFHEAPDRLSLWAC